MNILKKEMEVRTGRKGLMLKVPKTILFPRVQMAKKTDARFLSLMTSM
jgi:hypothetical protein